MSMYLLMELDPTEHYMASCVRVLLTKGMLWLLQLFSTLQSHVGVQGSVINPRSRNKKEKKKADLAHNRRDGQLCTIQIAGCHCFYWIQQKTAYWPNKDRFNPRPWNISTNQLIFSIKCLNVCFIKPLLCFAGPFILCQPKIHNTNFDWRLALITISFTGLNCFLCPGKWEQFFLSYSERKWKGW